MTIQTENLARNFFQNLFECKADIRIFICLRKITLFFNLPLKRVAQVKRLTISFI